MPLLEPIENKRRLAGQAIWVLGWVIVTGIGLYLTPSPDGHGTHQQLGLSPCPSALFFNRPCPGCGLTTSWTALLHGNLEASFSSHWLGPFLYLLFTWSAIVAATGLFQSKRFNTDGDAFNRSVIVVGSIFFAYGFVRMAVVNDFRSPRESAMSASIGLSSGSSTSKR
jgi:hypothetical protein